MLWCHRHHMCKAGTARPISRQRCLSRRERRPSQYLRVVARLLTLAAFLVVPVVAETKSGSNVSLAFSPNVSSEEINERDLAAVFLGQKRQWSDGTRVKIAILKSPGSQSEVLNIVTDRSPGQYWAHWRNIVFSGRGIMPRVFQSEAALLDYIASEKGAIGPVYDKGAARQHGVSSLPLTGRVQL